VQNSQRRDIDLPQRRSGGASQTTIYQDHQNLYQINQTHHQKGRIIHSIIILISENLSSLCRVCFKFPRVFDPIIIRFFI
jgi:hypothetical protein